MIYRIYIAASYRHLHAVRLLGRELRVMCPEVEILDWTVLSTPPVRLAPPEGLTSEQRRAWMDLDHGNKVFRFCRDACASADLVIYLGASGQDAGVEIGIAFGSGVEVIGLRGPLESPGLMLNGTVSDWVDTVEGLIYAVNQRVECARLEMPEANTPQINVAL